MLIAAALFVSAEVLGRKFLEVSLDGANEMSGYVVAITSAWAFSYTLVERAHIRIDAVYGRVSVRIAALIDVMSALTLAIFAAMLVWFSFRLLEFAWVNNTRANTTLQTPQWVPLLLWYAGLVLFLVMSVIQSLRSGRLWLVGDYEGARRIAGMTANEAEVELQMTQVRDKAAPGEKAT